MNKLMKMYLFISSFVIFLVCAHLCGDTFRSKPKEQDLHGAWSGCTWGCTEFFRLELATNRTGFLVTLDAELNQSLYLVSNWRIEKDNLVLVLKPVGKAEPLEVKSLFFGNRYLEFEVRGVNAEWKRTITLYNERDWEERTRRAREARNGPQN